MISLDECSLASLDRIIVELSLGQPITHPVTGKPVQFLFTRYGKPLQNNELRAELDRAVPTVDSRLAGGYCLLAPAQEPCLFANICEDGPSVRTKNSNLTVLRAQRKDSALLVQDARSFGGPVESAD